MPFFLIPAALILAFFTVGFGPVLLVVASVVFVAIIMVPVAFWLCWFAFLIACVVHPIGWAILFVFYFVPVVIPTILFSGTAFGDTMKGVAHWYNDMFYQIVILPVTAFGWARAAFNFIF